MDARVAYLSQAPSYHLIFEAVLIVCIIRLFFVKSYKPERTVLTEKVNFLINILYHFTDAFLAVYSVALFWKILVPFPMVCSGSHSTSTMYTVNLTEYGIGCCNIVGLSTVECRRLFMAMAYVHCVTFKTCRHDGF